MTSGILLLDKPAGISSNVAVQQVRRLFGRVKAGHTGTLDPLATGLLPVCLGEATKFSHSLLDANKTYQAVIRLGFTSSTGDGEGIIKESGKPDFSPSDLHRVLRSFTGTIHQLPPMHSALKKAGRPLYSYARAGEEVPRALREVVISRLEQLDFKGNTLSIRVTCSKGTYIRVLAEDIGKALGCGGYLLVLRRSGIGGLDITDAIGLDELGALEPESRALRLLPVDRLVSDLPPVSLSDEAVKRIRTGLDVRGLQNVVTGAVRLYDHAGAFLGVGEGDNTHGVVIPKRMLATQPRVEKTENV